MGTYGVMGVYAGFYGGIVDSLLGPDGLVGGLLGGLKSEAQPGWFGVEGGRPCPARGDLPSTGRCPSLAATPTRCE